MLTLLATFVLIVKCQFGLAHVSELFVSSAVLMVSFIAVSVVRCLSQSSCTFSDFGYIFTCY